MADGGSELENLSNLQVENESEDVSTGKSDTGHSLLLQDWQQITFGQIFAFCLQVDQ